MAKANDIDFAEMDIDEIDELEEKSQLIDKATNKIEELLGSIEIDG
mgnify:CR=1 FL=1